jgi:2-succinyl-5-enolpyruvyl-6-hydroxy-3-cyclohexene-1-carboxylate synthase
MQIKVNRNHVWANILVDQLAEFGVKYACISPGSRSTPLTYALAQKRKITTYPIIDERTSGFFALGLAKQTNSPVIIVTTSGTAAAELYPSIIEAYQNRVPLIICTADRPAYLRNTGANQTINQDNLFKNHIRFFHDAGLPKLKAKEIEKFKKSICTAFNIAANENRGPVHLNFPFEKPLEPNSYTDEIEENIISKSLPLNISDKRKSNDIRFRKNDFEKIIGLLKRNSSVLITVGPGNFSDKFVSLLEKFSAKFAIPIFADASSGLAFKPNRLINLVSNFDALIRSESFKKLFIPQISFHFGRTATSNNLELFLSGIKSKRFVINRYGDMFDSYRKSVVINMREEDFIEAMIGFDFTPADKSYKNLTLLKALDEKIEEVKSSVILNSGKINEPSILINILNAIPPNSNLMIGNSIPIRDMDFFSSSITKNINVFQNRGASGIDGVTSTALGICLKSKNPTYLITGDLAFYYDLNSLLLAKQFEIPLIVILINNNGGGIFRFLPIAEHKDVFDKYFLTPTHLSFKAIVEAFGIDYKELKTHQDILTHIKVSNVRKKAVVFEIKTNSDYSLSVRRKYWKKVIKFIDNFARNYET